MLEGTLSVYVCILLFPLAVIAGLLFLVRNYVRSTEFCDSDSRFDGKTIVITGGSSGLGLTLSKELCRRGARVIVACRTKARRDSTGFFLRSKTGSLNLRTMFMDLSSLDSICDFCRDLVESEEKIDAVVCNAGILKSDEHTMDELDLMHGVNYVGHFLMVNLLLEKLLKYGTCMSPIRVVNVVCSSFRHGHIPNMDELEGKVSGSYRMKHIYRSSKLCLHLLTKQLSQKYMKDGLVSYSVDPGYSSTALYRHLEGFFGKFNRTMAIILYRMPIEGIQTIMHCLASTEILRDSGKLYKDCRIQDARNSEWTENNIQQLWDRTKELIESKGLSLILKNDPEEEEEAEVEEEVEVEENQTEG